MLGKVTSPRGSRLRSASPKGSKGSVDLLLKLHVTNRSRGDHGGTRDPGPTASRPGRAATRQSRPKHHIRRNKPIKHHILYIELLGIIFKISNIKTSHSTPMNMSPQTKHHIYFRRTYSITPEPCEPIPSHPNLSNLQSWPTIKKP